MSSISQIHSYYLIHEICKTKQLSCIIASKLSRIWRTATKSAKTWRTSATSYSNVMKKMFGWNNEGNGLILALHMKRIRGNISREWASKANKRYKHFDGHHTTQRYGKLESLSPMIEKIIVD